MRSARWRMERLLSCRCQGIADANVFLRTTERILLKIAEVKAETFDELFEATKALPWERYISSRWQILDCESQFSEE